MAQVTGTFSTYDAVGNREDLIDNIFDVSPTETPILTAIGKTKAKATKHDWQVYALAAAADNAHVEGDEATFSAPNPTTRVDNQTQILKKTIIVSGTQEAVDKAGRNSDLAFYQDKYLKELKRDLERAIVGVNNAKVVGNDTTPREMGSLQSYVNTNTSFGAGGADPTGDGSDARTDGTQRAVTESILEDVLQDIWVNSTGDQLKLVVGAHNKGAVSDFTTAATRYVSSDNKKLVASIDVYDGDFQTVTLCPDRFSRSRDALLINPQYLKLAELRGMQSKELARTGDAEKHQMLMECTLEVCNEAAHGIIADLTTS